MLFKFIWSDICCIYSCLAETNIAHELLLASVFEEKPAWFWGIMGALHLSIPRTWKTEEKLGIAKRKSMPEQYVWEPVVVHGYPVISSYSRISIKIYCSQKQLLLNFKRFQKYTAGWTKPDGHGLNICYYFLTKHTKLCNGHQWGKLFFAWRMVLLVWPC